MNRFFRVKNYEKFQHYPDRNPPWIKLYNSLLDNYEFSQLPDQTKGHLLMILLLASRLDNKLPWDEEWISLRVHAKSKIKLDLLREFGFIEEFQMLRLPEQVAPVTGAQPEGNQNIEKNNTSRLSRLRRLSESEWLAKLVSNPAYTHIAIDRELAKMDAWLSTQPGRTKSRRFIINWLNKIEPPVTGKTGSTLDPKLQKNLEAISEAQRRWDEKRNI